MAKLTRFQRSQRAHKLLAKKHGKTAASNAISWLRHGYHNDVFNKQSIEKRILTNEEKKRIYRNNEYYAFN